MGIAVGDIRFGRSNKIDLPIALERFGRDRGEA